MIDNGIFQLTLSKPDGIVTGIQYNGVDNLMEVLNREDNRGYTFLSKFVIFCTTGDLFMCKPPVKSKFSYNAIAVSDID